MQNDLLDRLQDLNEKRPSLPGEHWLTLAAGVLLMGRSGSSVFGSALSKAAGAALVWRALQGRDGLIALLRGQREGARARGSMGSGSSRRPGSESVRGEGYVEVASPWPYEEHVRVATDANRDNTGVTH